MRIARSRTWTLNALNFFTAPRIESLLEECGDAVEKCRLWHNPPDNIPASTSKRVTRWASQLNAGYEPDISKLSWEFALDDIDIDGRVVTLHHLGSFQIPNRILSTDITRAVIERCGSGYNLRLTAKVR
jgi:hypothetical protein